MVEWYITDFRTKQFSNKKKDAKTCGSYCNVCTFSRNKSIICMKENKEEGVAITDKPK